jgi:hypothetical protein
VGKCNGYKLKYCLEYIDKFFFSFSVECLKGSVVGKEQILFCKP